LILPSSAVDRRRLHTRLGLLSVLAFVLGVGVLTWQNLRHSESPPVAEQPTKPPAVLVRLVPKILAVYPHDPRAYTQGLLWQDGELYESTGLYGTSTLRRVTLETGKIQQEVAPPAEVFAEGLALVGERLIQLTWQEKKALVWNRRDFAPLAGFTYEGEGWGLAWDGRRLVMSDGSNRLTLRDPQTFAVVGDLAVTREQVPVDFLNELEVAEGAIWANVWQRDEIVRIDPADGRVTAVVDASRLLGPQERGRAEVLNGIAYNPAKKTFYLTGKLWPKLFEVVFVPA
jgi:glutamine cyclotransferase